VEASARDPQEATRMSCSEERKGASTYGIRLARCLENLAILWSTDEEDCRTQLKTNQGLWSRKAQSRTTDAGQHEVNMGDEATDDIITQYLSHFSSDTEPSTSASSTYGQQSSYDNASLLSIPLADSYDERAEWHLVRSGATGRCMAAAVSAPTQCTFSTMPSMSGLSITFEAKMRHSSTLSSFSLSSTPSVSQSHRWRRCRGGDVLELETKEGGNFKSSRDSIHFRLGSAIKRKERNSC
jgi:hypothetical protein